MNDHAIRRDRSSLVAILTEWGAKFQGNSCRCPLPGHNDRSPSAGIFEGSDGVWRFKCQRCDNKPMDIFDVEAEMSGKDVKEVLRNASGLPEKGERQAVKKKATYTSMESAERNDYSIVGFTAKYRYTDTLYVYRIPKAGGGKRFCPLHQMPDGLWIAKKPDGVLPLYMPMPCTGRSLVFVEGEKCVDILASINVPAITTMGGHTSSRNGEFDWTPVVGKVVYVWADHDEDRVGELHAERVCALIEKAGGTAHLVDIHALGIPLKGDVEQYLAGLESRSEKIAALSKAFKTIKPHEPVEVVDEPSIESSMMAMVERERRGEGLPVPWPWRLFNETTQLSTPGTVSMIVAPPASSKSFGIIEAASFWCDEDIPFALYELEDRNSMHSFRALAQRTKQPGFTRPEWRAAHIDEVRDAVREHSAFLKKLNSQMYGQTDKWPTKESLLQWIKDRAKERPRIIVIDPITARKSGRDQWLDDEEFVDGIKRTVDENPDINITLVSHPRKGATEPHLDNIAGGVSFSRLLHKVIWIQSAYPSTKSLCKDTMATVEREHNRTIHALKLRDMPGTGLRIAMDFSSTDLCFHERGLIVSKESRKRGEISPFEQRAMSSSTRLARAIAINQQPVEERYEDESSELF